MHLFRRVSTSAVLIVTGSLCVALLLRPSAGRSLRRPDDRACFVAGTPVTLADGSTRPIEALAVGDRVLSYDEENGAVAEGVVAQRMVHPDTPELLRVNDEITTTPDHLFFVQGRWVAAGGLREGDILKVVRLASGAPVSSALPITQLEPLPGGVTTYNLEVTPHHVYFAGGILVHNEKRR